MNRPVYGAGRVNVGVAAMQAAGGAGQAVAGSVVKACPVDVLSQKKIAVPPRPATGP